MSGLLWVLILTTLGYMLGKRRYFKVRGPADVMPDAAPGGAAGFGLAGSLVVLWKRNMEIGGKGCKYLACRFAS